MSEITRDEAFTLLKKYNKDPFHIQHALTVEAVMKWYARELGYGAEEEHWGIVGLLHDIDFELYPAEHCLKAPELLREGGVSEDIIHGVVSHGCGITIECGVTLDVEPVHEMEKVLFAADELTGLIWAAALMRPSKSTKDMELKSLKKKYKSKGFAAGCSRKVIERGAEQLDWPLEKLLTMTMQAMADSVREALGIAGYGPRQIEGYGVANWILMDYNDIIVHIFSDESRTFYDLERTHKKLPEFQQKNWNSGSFFMHGASFSQALPFLFSSDGKILHDFQ